MKGRYTAILIEIVPSTENDVDLDIETTAMGWMDDYPEIYEKIEELVALIDVCSEHFVSETLKETADENDSD